MKALLTTNLAAVTILTIGVTGLSPDRCLGVPVCVHNTGNTKHVCVEWSKQAPPEEDDFDVDYGCDGCSDAPAVELRTGDTQWVVYSEVISTGAVANIGALTTTDADNYGVKIAKGNGAGAANLGSMVLAPSGDHYSSIASGSGISGNLTGNLAVQKTTGGSGGTLSLTIGGDVRADILIPRLQYLYVYGNVECEAMVIVADAGDYAGLTVEGEEFSGVLVFPNGLTGMDKTVDIYGTLMQGALVDFNEGELGILLNLYGGAAVGGIVGAGTLTGAVRLGELGYPFSGMAVFGEIAEGSNMELELANLEGAIEVSGDWAGRLEMFGDVSPDAMIWIGGDLTATGAIAVFGDGELGDLEGSIDVAGSVYGSITAWRNIQGSINVGGDLDGDILANQLGYYGGEVTGDVTIEGEFNGNICGDNLSPMQALPENISIPNFGDSGTICGARPGCGNGTISSSEPVDGTRDARQPHPLNDCSLSARQGIGSAAEPIVITLTEGGANNLGCWALCETGIEEVDTGQGCNTPEANAIKSLTETSAGVYEIVLDRPISAGQWTTVSYLADESYVSYASLPMGVSRNGWVLNADISLLNGILDGGCQSQYSIYQWDINRNEVCEAGTSGDTDLNRGIDVEYGYGKFIQWFGEHLPSNTCPGSGNRFAPAVGDEGSRADLVEDFVELITTWQPTDSESAKELDDFLGSVVALMYEHLSDFDMCELVDRLQDPNLAFVSQEVKALVPWMIAVLES